MWFGASCGEGRDGRGRGGEVGEESGAHDQGSGQALPWKPDGDFLKEKILSLQFVNEAQTNVCFLTLLCSSKQKKTLRQAIFVLLFFFLFIKIVSSKQYF